MVKVRDRIKVHEDWRSLEVVAVSDAGAGGSHLGDRVAEGIEYERYPQPRRVPLAVKEKEAEVVGHVPVVVDIEVARCALPEKETLGVIRDLDVDAIVGLNLIQKYDIGLERDAVGFREYPPRAFLL